MKKDIQEELENKTEEICSLFEKDKNILSCGYTGSLSKGYADEFSDLDIIFICKGKPTYKEIYRKISKLNKNIDVFNKRKDESYHFLYKGTIATIWPLNIDKINKTIKDVKNKFDMKLASSLSSITDFQIVNGDEKIINSLKKQTEIQIPKETIKQEFASLYQWIVNNTKKEGRLEIEMKRNNIISFQYRLNRTIGWIIQLIYSANNKIFQDARWAYKEIPKMRIKPNNCLAKLNKISLLGNKPKEMQIKLNLLRKLVKDLEN